MDYKISDKLAALKPSAIREIFKSLTDPTVISFAAGNPARVIRRITEADRFRYGRGQTADPEAEAEMRRVWAEHPDDPAFPTAPEE